MRELTLLLTCEHGGQRVPPRWARLFAGARARQELRSHRGWDAGALELARRLSRSLHAPLLACTTTRLLVDANRPPGHPRLFSAATRALEADERQLLLREIHAPHWRAVERQLRLELARRSGVLHLAIHSFTPRLRGVTRRCDVGLLYDPARPLERALCRGWQAELRSSHPGLRVRRNHPYRGRSAGLTTHLRGVFAPEVYLGIELEINQALWSSGGRPSSRDRLSQDLAAALRAALRSV